MTSDKRLVELTPDILAICRNEAMKGVSNKNIAGVIGVSERTFVRRMSDSPELVYAILEGRAMGEAFAAQELFKLIKASDFQAIKLYLKARCGWNDSPMSRELQEKILGSGGGEGAVKGKQILTNIKIIDAIKDGTDEESCDIEER